jgi:hypothetical protein
MGWLFGDDKAVLSSFASAHYTEKKIWLKLGKCVMHNEMV